MNIMKVSFPFFYSDSDRYTYLTTARFMSSDRQKGMTLQGAIIMVTSGECELTRFAQAAYIRWCIQAPCSRTKDFKSVPQLSRRLSCSGVAISVERWTCTQQMSGTRLGRVN